MAVTNRRRHRSHNLSRLDHCVCCMLQGPLRRQETSKEGRLFLQKRNAARSLWQRHPQIVAFQDSLPPVALPELCHPCFSPQPQTLQTTARLQQQSVVHSNFADGRDALQKSDEHCQGVDNEQIILPRRSSTGSQIQQHPVQNPSPRQLRDSGEPSGLPWQKAP